MLVKGQQLKFGGSVDLITLGKQLSIPECPVLAVRNVRENFNLRSLRRLYISMSKNCAPMQWLTTDQTS